MDDRAWAPQRKILPGAAGRVLVPGHPWALGGLWRDLQVVAAWGGGGVSGEVPGDPQALRRLWGDTQDSRSGCLSGTQQTSWQVLASSRLSLRGPAVGPGQARGWSLLRQLQPAPGPRLLWADPRKPCWGAGSGWEWGPCSDGCSPPQVLAGRAGQRPRPHVSHSAETKQTPGHPVHLGRHVLGQHPPQFSVQRAPSDRHLTSAL